MSGSVACTCPGTFQERKKHWRVWHRQHNHSAFNGYRYTPSAYSAVRCMNCSGLWRTTAKYVEELPGNCLHKDGEGGV